MPHKGQNMHPQQVALSALVAGARGRELRPKDSTLLDVTVRTDTSQSKTTKRSKKQKESLDFLN